jgi:hypothetical protein
MSAEQQLYELHSTLFRCLVDVVPEDEHRKVTREALALASYAVKLLRAHRDCEQYEESNRIMDAIDRFLETGNTEWQDGEEEAEGMAEVRRADAQADPGSQRGNRRPD